MNTALTNPTVIWVIALVLLVACWPVAQRLRHDKLHPVAAYLLFTSMLLLVSTTVFWVAIWVASLIFAPNTLESAVLAILIVVLSLAPGFVAGRWIVRQPQVRRMPK